MNQKSGLDLRNECFIKFSSKFPSLKTQYIKKAINDFNCDYEKINNYLATISFEESRNNNSESIDTKPQGIFSFSSKNSDNNGSETSSPAGLRNSYRNSSELSTISSQNCDLKRLEDAFRGMEIHRDYLKKEMECLKEVSNQRKSVPNFPNISELEKIERLVNKKYSLPPKSASYINDLRREDQTDGRYKGAKPQISDGYLHNSNYNHRSISENQNVKYPLISNLNSSPKPNFLFPFMKLEEKRNSAQFPENYQLPDELVGHKSGHSRQKSDPWVLESIVNNGSSWQCQNCMKTNNSSKCSCSYTNRQSERF